MKLIRPIAVTTANLDSTSVAETLAAWDVATPYAADALVYRAVDGIHRGYKSAQASNTGHVPEADDGTWWLDQGATLPWKMFDRSIQSQTTAADSLTVAIQLGADEIADTVRLSNLSAASAQVTVTDATDGVVYDRTFDLVSDSGISDWWAYFAEPIVRRTGLTVADLPGLYAGALVTIALSAPGETVACGLALLGQGRDLGGTQWGPQLGFRDFSVKADDGFGGQTVVERGFRRQMSANVVVQAGMVDELQRLFETYRATPILLVGDDAYDTMAIYGFIKSFQTVVSWPEVSFCTIDAESLA